MPSEKAVYASWWPDADMVRLLGASGLGEFGLACGTTETHSRTSSTAARNPESTNVADFSPFAGVRYQGGSAELAALVAPPYDVIDDDQLATLEAMDEHNSVRLILPRDDTTEGDRYDRAADTFARWLAEGVLFRDDAPRFYAYRMEFTDPHGARRHTRGVIGALTLPEPGDDDVLPHERTLPKAKSDRLALLRAMRVNVDPIWGLSLGSGLTALLDRATPLVQCLDPDGVYHEIAAIDDPKKIAAIGRVVGSAPLVLADGHHRFETAINYRNQLRDASDDPGSVRHDGAAAIMTFVVELADDELCIEPIHRLIDAAGRHRRPGPARRRVRRRRRGREHARRRRRADRIDARAPGPRDRRHARPRPRRPPGRSARRGARGRAPGRGRDRRRRHRGAGRSPTRRGDLAVPPRRPWGRRARRQGRGHRRDPLLTRLGRDHPGGGRRPRAHAAEDDVLLAQAPDGNGLSRPRLMPAPAMPAFDPTGPGYATVQVGAERNSAARSPGPDFSDAAAICCCIDTP